MAHVASFFGTQQIFRVPGNEAIVAHGVNTLALQYALLVTFTYTYRHALQTQSYQLKLVAVKFSMENLTSNAFQCE